MHKVRGQPAFDIAERCGMCKEPCQPQCGLWPGCQNEEWWIIPTSGHTAHPWKFWELDDPDRIAWTGDVDNDIPTDWPDHYPYDVGREVKVNVGSILSKLLPKVHRRL